MTISVTLYTVLGFKDNFFYSLCVNLISVLCEWDIFGSSST